MGWFLLGHLLVLEVTYQILKSNFDKECIFYTNNINDNYDDCKESTYEKRIVEKFNCTVPWRLESQYKVCKGENAKVKQYSLRI